MLKKKRLATLIILTTLLFVASFIIFQKESGAPSSSDEKIEFVISPGESVDKIANRLKEEGLIKNPLAFRIILIKEKIAQKIQAGKFLLSANMSAYEIAQKLTVGFSDIKVTIPEGWRTEEIAALFEKELNIPQNEFLSISEEGKMFPDTYSFKSGSKADEVAEILKENYRLKFDEKLKAQALAKNLSEKEVLIFASIVEREAKFASDRPIVAGILEKRYKEGMALEVDATVQYALGYSKEEKTWWRKNLTTDDLKLDSAYNTRKNAGLPPTPICNPGLDAIKAVINPVSTDYWYYISDKSGKMHYAKDLDGHIKNIQDYL